MSKFTRIVSPMHHSDLLFFTYLISWINCFSGRPVVARLGNLKLDESYNVEIAKPQHRNIIRIFAHPLYKYPSEYHDIALFKLDKPIEFSYYVRQACLSPYPTNNLGVWNNTVTAAGWGVVDWGKTFNFIKVHKNANNWISYKLGEDEGSNDLLKADLQLLDHKSCSAAYDTGAPDPKIANGVVDKWQMCAGAEGKDTCQVGQ